MALPKRLTLLGAPGSPYTRKMLALLRYRHITHNMVWGDPSNPPAHLFAGQIPKSKVALHPTFYFETSEGTPEAAVDSTPIIRRLEKEQAGRSVIPADPVLAFIDYLLEDYGDEWCTKFMFHYRWHFDADIDRAGTLIPLWIERRLSGDLLAQFKETFSQRQISRLGVVGSNTTTAAVIEACYQRLLGLLDKHLQAHNFLLGERPGSGDFALYGQFTQLTGVDPTPMALAYDISPRSVAWVHVMEDLSGLEPQDSDWLSAETIPQTLRDILAEVGRSYVPAMLANARAIAAGEEYWETEIDGKRWTQKSFPYQAKCLQWLNDEFKQLSVADQAKVNAVLAGTGCEALIF